MSPGADRASPPPAFWQTFEEYENPVSHLAGSGKVIPKAEIV